MERVRRSTGARWNEYYINIKLLIFAVLCTSRGREIRRRAPVGLTVPRSGGPHCAR